MGTTFNQEGQVVHGAQINIGVPTVSAAMPTGAECVNVDRARGQVAVEVFAPECRGDRGLSPITVIFANGEFDHIRVCDDLDDSDEAASVKDWIEENGDECWASLEDYRRGPTLSLRALCALAIQMSAEGGAR